ncbi:MAG: SAM-dependent methyltransferase [Chloroflexi bacterium]|nr:SAM-dependent methyltransferase [Chloroflexota bacterium]
MTTPEMHPASFRDPSGFIFRREGILYRQVNHLYQPEYDRLMASGLYQELVKKGMLIPHQEVAVDPAELSQAYKIIQPETLEFISYPHEWSFSEYKDAALLTLDIQKRALEHDLSLKDASAYNIQFHKGKPVLIDTLSFEIYREGEPWVAYRQFCQHFLAPLALMALRDIRLNRLMAVYIDGIPLDLASELLPGTTRLNLALLTHLHLHAGAQKRYAGKQVKVQDGKRRFTRLSFSGLIDSLQSAVRGLKWTPQGTEWADYYEGSHNYSNEAFEAKRKVVQEFLESIHPDTVWDLGSNTGVFSRVASEMGCRTVAFDIDPAAVEQNYVECKSRKERNMLPLVMDLTNPSPAIGWENRERMALCERGPVDALLALALIHHLAISNNVPFDRLAHFFSEMGRWLVIEFVPKSDSQVQRLLSTRQDIFHNYTRSEFEKQFGEYYHLSKAAQLEGSERVVYLMERKDE